MTEDGVEAAAEDQELDPDPEAEEGLVDPRPTRQQGARGAGVGEEVGTGAGADQKTGAANLDQETGRGPDPGPKWRRLAFGHRQREPVTITTQTRY